MTDQNAICVYHADCQDGFSAAWAVWKALGDIEFYRGIHGEAPPLDLMADKHVILVDFSYPLEKINQIIEVCASLLILDHHKTAREALSTFPAEGFGWDDHKKIASCAVGNNPMLKVGVVFDMERSGAVIAWNYFHPRQAVPQLLLHVQDRDLWKFELESTRDITGYLFSLPYSFRVWDLTVSNFPASRLEKIKLGEAINRKHDKDIAELLPLTKRLMAIGGYQVPVANMPYTMASDAANIMAVGQPFAATYYDGRVFRFFSLRSVPGGVDVSEVAKKYGGGGHKHASGFRMEIGWEGDPDWGSAGVP